MGDPSEEENGTGNDQARGLLQTRLLDTTDNLPAGYGESNYTLGANHSDRCAKVPPMAGNPKNWPPSESAWYSQPNSAMPAGPTQQHVCLAALYAFSHPGANWS